jgi:hypothetical protein
MFEPKTDRIDYGQILTPPDGFTLDFAVGTTYSLDLDAFIGACLSLGLSSDTESKLLDNPIFMLDNLHKTGDKIALFCEGGQIHLPSKVIPIHALLEKSVFQVVLKSSKGQYASFHPKFWLLSFQNDKGEKHYRLITLSRNLTFDMSWDIVVSLEGKQTDLVQQKNEAICDFLDFLSGYLPKDTNGNTKRKKIKVLKEQLKTVEFYTDSKIFTDFDFIPLGIRNNSTNKNYSIKDYPLFNDKQDFSQLIVMSPFISNGEIKQLNNRFRGFGTITLITRSMSLSKLHPNDCNNFDIYCMKSDVVDGDNPTEDWQKQDIHAKLYMLRTKFQGQTELYLGSMNASHNSIYNNVEFMIRLCCEKKYLNADKLKGWLFGGDEKDLQNPFEKIDIANIKLEETEEENLDSTIKAICRSKATAMVEQIGDKYDIVLNIKCKNIDYPSTISPLFYKDEQLITEDMRFSSIALKDLSQFYKVTVRGNTKTVERIIIINTIGIPENRDNAVISSIIPDTKSFYAYLSFVLGDNPVLGAIEGMQILKSYVGNFNAPVQQAALYEKMLKVAATQPQKLQSIDYILKAVGNDGIVPQEFIELYTMFAKVVKL